jgi:hypothetical protein
LVFLAECHRHQVRGPSARTLNCLRFSRNLSFRAARHKAIIRDGESGDRDRAAHVRTFARMMLA